MNIFVTNEDPQIAAQELDDLRTVKMIVETYQMLSAAVIRHGATPDMMPLTKAGEPMKAGHPHHPCTKWVGDSSSNYAWLCEYGLALCSEYSRRFGKVHRGESVIHQFAEMIYLIPAGEMTPFVQAMPDEFKDADVTVAYQDFLFSKPRHRWVRASPPDWWLRLSLSNCVPKGGV